MPPRPGAAAKRGVSGRTALLLTKAKQVQNLASLLPPDTLAFQTQQPQNSENQPAGHEAGALNQQVAPGCASTQGRDTAAQAARDQSQSLPQEASPALQDAALQQLDVSSKAGGAAGMDMCMQHYTASSLPAALHEWCFQLVKTSLKAMYEPVWGWNDKDKRAQLTAASAQFLVVWAHNSGDQQCSTGCTDTTTRADTAHDTARDGTSHHTPTALQAPQPPTTAATAATTATQPYEQQQCNQQEQQQQCNQQEQQQQCKQQEQEQQCNQQEQQQEQELVPNNQSPHAGTAHPGDGDDDDSSTAPRVPDQCQCQDSSTAEVAPVVLQGREAAAYLNFRIEEGYDKDPVLYVYEVMVGKRWQRLGLARRLMAAAEQLAWALGLDKVILTVLTANKAAKQMYCSLKYDLDSANPGPGKGYEIRSKRRPVEGSAPKSLGGTKKGKR